MSLKLSDQLITVEQPMHKNVCQV